MRAERGGGERGAALLLAMVLLAVLAGTLVTVGGLNRSLVGPAGIFVERSRNAALVEGAIEAAIPRLFRDGAAERLRADTKAVAFSVGADMSVPVRMSDACGRWDINRGNLDLLGVLLSETGMPKQATDRYVDLLREARESRQPFVAVGQALALPGLIEERRERLRSLLTVHCGADFVDLAFADPLLRRAARNLERSGAVVTDTGPGRVWYLSAQRESGPGTLVAVEAVVGLSNDRERPFRILEWNANE